LEKVNSCPSNVSRFLPEQARLHPSVAALKIPGGRNEAGEIVYLTLTFAQLDREANKWAWKLGIAGIKRGTRVLLMVKPGLSLISVCFALFKVGAVPIVIDPGMGLKSFLKCVRRSQPEALVGISLAQIISRLFRKKFASVSVRVSVKNHELLTDLESEVDEPFPTAITKADELAAILFTSGSTGAPKGVCYEHGMFEAQVRAIRETYNIQPGEVDLPMLPIFALFNPALGMTTVVPEINPSRPATVDPQKIVQAIKQCRVTNSFGSPVLWRKIGDHCLSENIQLPTMRRILMAGAPVPPSLMKDFQKILPHGEVHSPYGATEALPVSSIGDAQVLESAAAKTEKGAGTCVGKPLAENEVKIIAIEEGPLPKLSSDRILEQGQIGEIIVNGPVVTKRYDHLGEATAAAKINDGDTIWHRMGDLGYLDTEGFLWFCGRMAERVQTEEKLFYTDCCEAIFNQHPAVRRTALISWREGSRVFPAIVVQPESWPLSLEERQLLVNELHELGKAEEQTEPINRVFFHRDFPVDVRHNAKIHRLALGKFFARKDPVKAS
jgi:acyl-CoA synthetase (AMP-forming)/AMP-acid ligase II